LYKENPDPPLSQDGEQEELLTLKETKPDDIPTLEQIKPVVISKPEKTKSDEEISQDQNPKGIIASFILGISVLSYFVNL